MTVLKVISTSATSELLTLTFVDEVNQIPLMIFFHRKSNNNIKPVREEPKLSDSSM